MKKVWKIGKYVLATATLLVVVLIVHLVIVIKPLPNENLQLSRIDFNKPLSDDEATKIVSTIKNVDGVSFTHVNKEDGILVYSHDNKKVNSASAYNYFASHYEGSSTKFVVSEASLQGGCPAKIENSLAARFISGIQSVFN